MYYVYILKSEKFGKWYIGMSEDVERRRAEHNSGNVLSTKGFRPYRLVYQEKFATKTLALKRERQIKRSGAIRKAIQKQIDNMASSSNG